MSINLDRITRKLQPFIMKTIHDRMFATLKLDAVPKPAEGANIKFLRVALYLPINDTLKIVESYNMQGDNDICLELGLQSGGAGSCWQTHEMVVCDLEDAKLTYEVNWDMSEFQQKLVRQQLKSLLCVPVFNLNMYEERALSERSNPLIGVLCFDSDLDLLEDFTLEAVTNEARISAGLLSVALLGDLEAALDRTLMGNLNLPKRRML